LEGATLPQDCILFFGQEGAGMSEEAIAACSDLYENICFRTRIYIIGIENEIIQIIGLRSDGFICCDAK